MKWVLLSTLLLSGCASQSLRMDVQCFAYPRGPVIVIDCGDKETWQEYRREQKEDL